MYSAHYADYFTGPMEWDPAILVVGVFVLIALAYLLTKTGWPEL